MNIFHSIHELAGLKGPIVLAAGTFDGVHLGHQALIRRAMQEASSCGGTAVVMTFDRHPASLIRPEKAPALLTRNAEKITLLEEMGVPALLMLEFTREFSEVPAHEFISSLAEASSTLRAICVGSQWFFGRGGEGNLALLRELGADHDFEVIQIDPIEVSGTPISSTRIRAAIDSGDMEEASSCLGRPFLLSGEVVSGAGLGSHIGFPTANIETLGMQLPPNGVYAVKVRQKEQLSHGVCNIGFRPTVDASATTPVVEVHLFDVAKDLVGETLSLEFVKFLRPEKKFSGLEDLKSQIRFDCEQAWAIFSS